MKSTILVLGLSLLILGAGCSKKALTELATGEDQNNSNDSSNNNGGSNGGNGNTTIGGKSLYLMNTDTQFNQQNGSIIKYNATTEAFDLVYTDPNGRKLSNNEDDTSQYQYRTPGIRHPSDTSAGRYLMIGDNSDPNFTGYQLGYFNESLNSLTTIQLAFTNTEIAYSGNYAMLSASDGFNYVIQPTGYQTIDTYLGLDGTNESLKSTTSYFPLGKGFFIANSFAQGANTTDKFIIFHGNNSSALVKTNTNHLVQQVLKYTEDSALIYTKNAAGDQAIYYFKYADQSLTKIYEALVAQANIKINEKLYLDDNNDYYIMIRNTTTQRHQVYKILNSTGAMSLVAEQNASGMTTSLFNCGQYSFDKGDSQSFKSIIEINQKIYTVCKITTTQRLLISIDLVQQTIENYTVTTTSNIGDVFIYKDELYITSSAGSKKFSISNNQLTLVTENQGALMTDAQTNCSAIAPTGYQCSTMQIVGVDLLLEGIPSGWIHGMAMFYMITDGTTPMAVYRVINNTGDHITVVYNANEYHIFAKIIHQIGTKNMYASGF